MAEQMLVTQALDERDLLAKKIRDKIDNATFIDSIRNNEDKTMESRVSKAEFTKSAKASYQQIMDLIERYQMIDAKIIASNAETFIDTSYGKFSVAAAISLRNRLREKLGNGKHGDFETMLRDHLENDYDYFVEMIEEKNKQLKSTAENMRLSILGKDSKNKEERPLKVVDEYVKENTTEMVDPLSVKKKIEELTTKRDTLLTELDTRIKVSNAITLISLE